MPSFLDFPTHALPARAAEREAVRMPQKVFPGVQLLSRESPVDLLCLAEMEECLVESERLANVIREQLRRVTSG